MIQNHSVVFPDSQEPPAQCLGEEKKEISTRASGYDDDAAGFSLGESVSGSDILSIKKDVCVAYLVVDLKLLDHSQFHEHPQGGRYHGIDVQGEVVEGELVDPQLADEGDVGGLFRRSGKRVGGGGGSEDGVPFLEDT